MEQGTSDGLRVTGEEELLIEVQKPEALGVAVFTDITAHGLL